jgi:putative membrane protein
MTQRIAVALAALALAAAPAFAQAVASSDQSFAREASAGGLDEVALGTLAREKASNPDVKAFAERMITDHGKANDELKQWASSKNVTIAGDLDSPGRSTQVRLSKLSGDAFDKAYMKDMVADHRKDVAAFRKQSESAKDPELKAWAAKTLPTLEDHLKMAEEAAAKVGAR